MQIRNIEEADYDNILELNFESVQYLSPLCRERLEYLHMQSVFNRVIEEEGHFVAFLLSFQQGAVYDSPNYVWFNTRYKSFLYIDRLVVHYNFRGKGYGKILYEELGQYCLKNGHTVITCEVDIIPPNPFSINFHRKQGFVQVGSQWHSNGKKKVLLLEKRIQKSTDVNNVDGNIWMQ
jgi:predicted GNAT superfamily acetyltransferase